jgi:hypothetical protein
MGSSRPSSLEEGEGQSVLSLADVFQRAGEDVYMSSDDKGASTTMAEAAKRLDVKGKGRAEAGDSRKDGERKREGRSGKSLKKTSKEWDNMVDVGLLEEDRVEALFEW